MALSLKAAHGRIIADSGEGYDTESECKKDIDRVIGAVASDYILEHNRAYRRPKPPTIDHEGIEDAYTGKGSEVHYYYRGKWLKLMGAD
jgi:uncharacterized protein YegP (UPF0339 family)